MVAIFIMNTPSCWWSCYYFLKIIASLLLEISFPSYVAWAKLKNCEEPMCGGQGLVLNVELALKKPSLDRIQAQKADVTEGDDLCLDLQLLQCACM